MQLGSLLQNIEISRISGRIDIEVADITAHSKEVKPDSIFVALRGHRTNGALYIEEAVKNGAVCVIAEEEVSVPESITVVRVKDARKAMAQIAAKFYGNPSKSLNLIGITGTNGKTTTSYLVASCLKKQGAKVGIVGTIGYRLEDQLIPAPLTTPDCLTLQRLFKQMKENGIKDVVMEVSSHSLVCQRVAGCEFKIAVFTNLSQDHLDFHKDMETYYEAKKVLFKHHLDPEGKAIINLDDRWGKRLLNELNGQRVITYGMSSEADVFVEGYCLSLEGIEAKIITPLGKLEISSELIGRPNLYNILAAAAAAIGLGIPLNQIKLGLEDVKGVPGRLERIEGKVDVIIDYAHTPDALNQVLRTLRPLCKGNLITVFGCGGDRDKGKRPIMGQIASELSDFVIVTNDNPRTEPSRQIIQDIEMGIKKDKPYCIVPDRRQAILWAIKHAQRGDIVLIAGKGHEDYQIIGDKKYHFSDKEEVLKVLSRM